MNTIKQALEFITRFPRKHGLAILGTTAVVAAGLIVLPDEMYDTSSRTTTGEQTVVFDNNVLAHATDIEPSLETVFPEPAESALMLEPEIDPALNALRPDDSLEPESELNALRDDASEQEPELNILQIEDISEAEAKLDTLRQNNAFEPEISIFEREDESGSELLQQPTILWESITIRSGDTLSSIFSRNQIGATALHEILRTSHGAMLAKIQPGQIIKLGMLNGKLQALQYQRTKLEKIEYTRTESGFLSTKITRAPDIRHVQTSGIIENSLFIAATNAGLTDNMTMQLVDIFGWDVDFVMDIREGDSFNLVYEEKYLDNKKIGYGDILAATFTNRDQTLEAIRYEDSTGNAEYYSPNGESMRKSFIRTPVDFTRISSKFNPNRLHPIFKTKRPHKAVDYAAATGTPIKAAGDGVVQFSGKQNGYGNVVFIKHPNNVVTVYAHQSRIARNLRKGQRVKQGQVIGYVGQTGWATGPHLHFEFRVNGIHRNPLTVKLPNAKPLHKKEMGKFNLLADKLLAELKANSVTMLASTDESRLDEATNVTIR